LANRSTTRVKHKDMEMIAPCLIIYSATIFGAVAQRASFDIA
jgi:hypothetical protein